jgi:hypothetical protein
MTTSDDGDDAPEREEGVAAEENDRTDLDSEVNDEEEEEKAALEREALISAPTGEAEIEDRLNQSGAEGDDANAPEEEPQHTTVSQQLEETANDDAYEDASDAPLSLTPKRRVTDESADVIAALQSQLGDAHQAVAGMQADLDVAKSRAQRVQAQMASGAAKTKECVTELKAGFGVMKEGTRVALKECARDVRSLFHELVGRVKQHDELFRQVRAVVCPSREPSPAAGT